MLPQRAQSTQRFIKSSVFSVVSVVTPPSQQDATTASREYTEVYKILRALCGLCALCGTPTSQQDATTTSREYTEVYKILRALCALCGKIFIPAFPFRGSAYHTIIQTFIRIATHLSSRLRLQSSPNFGDSGWSCATGECERQSGCR